MENEQSQRKGVTVAVNSSSTKRHKGEKGREEVSGVHSCEEKGAGEPHAGLGEDGHGLK